MNSYGKKSIMEKRQLLTNKKLNIKMRKHFVKCYMEHTSIYEVAVKHGPSMN